MTKLKWPDCKPVDKSQPYWEFNNNLSVNGTPYMKAEVEPGRWQWVIDEESSKALREREQRRSDLWWALRTRVLTYEEMQEVRKHGHYLIVRDGQSYKDAEVRREFNEALTRQAYLRLDAERPPPTSAPPLVASPNPVAPSVG